MDLSATFLLGKKVIVREGKSHREEAHRSAFLLILRDSESQWRQHRKQLARQEQDVLQDASQADVDRLRIENLPPVPHKWLCNLQLLYRMWKFQRYRYFQYLLVIRLLTQNWKSERDERKKFESHKIEIGLAAADGPSKAYKNHIVGFKPLFL